MCSPYGTITLYGRILPKLVRPVVIPSNYFAKEMLPMSSVTQHIFRPLGAVLLFALTGCLNANMPNGQSSTNTQHQLSAQNKPMSEMERKADRLRRIRILDNTQNIFTLLGAEIALNRGQASLALNTYLNILHKTKNPEVAERAMELAVSIRAHDTAERIYAQWQKLEPEPGPAQRRIAWTRALSSADFKQVARTLETVIAEANEEQARRIFLLLAQVGTENHILASEALKPLHRVVNKHYPNMTEALIASTLFDSVTGDTEQAIQDLQQLAHSDTQLTPTTRLALGMIVRDNPKLLPAFFQKTDSTKLSPIWQELEIESLIQDKQYDKAYDRLKTLIENKNDADLYIQAAVLSYQHKNDLETTLNYLEKAHMHGTQAQKSRAAILAAIRLLADHRFEECKKWIDRITSPETIFDKFVLQVSLAAEQEHWQEALRIIDRQPKDLPPGSFFNNNDLLELQLFALLQSGRSPQQTLRALNQIIKEASQEYANEDNLAAALYQRGLLYSEEMNRFQQAIEDFRHFLRLRPNDTQGMNALGYTLLDKPEYREEAFELIKKAYQQDPESPEINDSIGWAYFIRGDAQTALPYLEYAYQQKSDPDNAAHLGEVYWQLNQKDQAIKIWKEAWKKDRKNKLLNQMIKKYRLRF